jgi:DNA-binding phage protein
LKEDRAQQHGDFHHNLSRITRLRTVYLGQALDDHDVAYMMALLKVSRTLTGTTNPGYYVDLAEYAAIAAELAEDIPTL